ncbi:unnamed protein product [Microthlaspi erraticum]|uniref:TF-B3 domain-containing protein n=1 Tax=Microthlaspi erraticum TaxID=1685480 RepID=A0A6D2I9F4_9BRAS|nr:unnamed protein product [Microthlaspi erraticum]
MAKHEEALDFDLNELPFEQREAERGTHENFNGASSSRHIGIDLNEPLPFSDSVSERSEYEQLNGASSLNIRIDLNKPPSEYETPWLSLSLTYHQSIPETPPNPNPQPSTSKGKKPLVRKRRKSSGGNKRGKKPRREAALVVDPPPTPAWLVQAMESMEEAEDARLILKKSLFKSDVKRAQSRFLISFNQLERNDFLTQEESILLEQDKVDKVEKGKGIKVVVVNQRSEKWNLRFKKWEMRNKTSESGSLHYVLNRGWNDIVEGNTLKAGDKIDLWSFRSQGSLCFALAKE